MYVSDDIEVIQGSLGSGKSLVAMMECVMQLKAGGVVATNFTFNPIWAYLLAETQVKARFSAKKRYELACSYWDRAFKIGCPDSMIELSGDRGSKLAELCVGELREAREGKGLLVLDDCHHYFNARNYGANKEYVTFFANARKYGWRTKLITHDVENIDKQVRTYIEIESRFRNWAKLNIPLLSWLILRRFPMFRIHRRYFGKGPGAGGMHSKDLYFLDRTIASLYDTLERFTPDDVTKEVGKQGLHPSEYVYVKGMKEKSERKGVRLMGQASVWPNYREIIQKA